MNAFAQLKIGIPSFSKKINHTEIHSVREYVIFDDLLRSLVKFDSNGELAPDLAESWEIKDQYKKFILHIKTNQRFSDNSIITASDVVKSLQAIVKKPEIIHGDGNKIKNVSILNDNQVVIELLESNPFFLTELSAPEYRVVKVNNDKYNVTSGPYYVKKNDLTKKISLQLNEHYPFDTDVKFKEVDYISYDKLSEGELNSFDIIWPKSTMTLLEIEDVKKHGYFVHKLNIGFSYWLSLNPNNLSNDERIFIKHRLDSTLSNSSFFSNNNFIRSSQLFLPSGPGRLTDKEVESINKRLNTGKSIKLKKLNILLPKNIQKELLESIKTSFDFYELNYYSDFAEYAKLIKTRQYDIALVNNDLSSVDLRSSLLVTFNNARPLIWIEKNKSDYDQLINNINNELNSVKRYQLIKQLGSKVLDDVIVYPLYYDFGFVLAKKGIDFSQLNVSGAETYSWKIK